MALTPARVIISEDASGTPFKSFTDLDSNHAQAVALVNESGQHMGIPGTPINVTSVAYLSRGIVEGHVYSIQDSLVVPNNGIRNYSIVVPDTTTRIFFKFNFELQNAFAVSFFEGSVFSSTGTVVVPSNHNRNITTPSVITTGIDATATSDGTRLYYALFDSSGTTQTGDLPTGEWILKNATNYMLRFDNDSNAGTVRVNIYWLELPQIV